MKISYPLIGNYGFIVQFFLDNVLKDEIIKPPIITTKTLELGSKYSPDFVCTPFKYTLGTMIESLEHGADTLIQLGGGCRYGYYHELQNQILKDLGYHFQLINLINGGNYIKITKLIKEYHLHPKYLKIPKYYIMMKQMVKYLDNIEDYIRKNRCYEKEKGAFNQLEGKMIKDFITCSNAFKLRCIYKKYLKQFKLIPMNKPSKEIKIGIIGELYTLMESFSNYNIEQKLNDRGISVTRFTNASYLLFEKKNKVKKYLKELKIKYRMGADALDNIYHTEYMCKNNYDGIIHIKSSFCTPEILVKPIIEDIAQKHDVPVIFFSIDMNTSETGFETRLDAFCDMLEMRNK